MKTKYSIGLLILLIVIIYLSYNFIYNEKNNNSSNVNAEEYIKTDGQALNENCYYLYEINGYVTVFLSDKKTPYEYTDIKYNELPEIVQNEIKNGKYIEGTEELYGFLENYSS